MRYMFVFLAIVSIWVALILITAFIPSARTPALYAAGQAITVFLFVIGFYKK